MAIEINTNNISTSIASQTDFAADGNVVGKSSQTGSILGGDSLKVTSGVTTDLEKLVMRLKNESDGVRQSIAERRIAILSTVLDTMAERINEEDRKNLLEIEKLNGQLETTKTSLANLEAQKTAAEGRIAVLDAKIAALENAVEQGVQDGKDHREQVAKLKEQRARVDAKVRELTNSIASANSTITSINGQIESLTLKIGAATLTEVAAAVKAAAGEVKVDDNPETAAERKKAEEKEAAFNVSNIISDALDELDSVIMKTIEENREIKA